jgi:hypothetical protein
MALDTTVGGANANSYATLAEADAYNAAHPYGSTWTGTDPQKEAALIIATLVLDGWPRSWTGTAVDGVQALTWPRNGMFTRNGYAIAGTIIPKELKNAQSELARKILEADVTANNDIVNQGIKSIGVGPISLSFAGLDAVNSRLVSRIQRELDAMMAMMPDSVKLLLVPSWILPDPEARLPVLMVNL